MARLLGNTRRQINWVLWVGLFIVLAVLAAMAAWLLSAAAHLIIS